MNESASRTLLDDVIASYLGTLSEVEFFDAFEAILRANGFYDIARTHGPAEFGRDFVAKRSDGGEVRQYAIQTKAGDLGQSGWRDVRNQIEDIRLTRRSNPAFDPDLPRVAVLATTGRLVGNAPSGAHDYKLEFENGTTFFFEVWQLEHLIEMMVDAPEAGLAGDAGVSVLGAIAAIHLGNFGESDLNQLSTGWIRPDAGGLWRLALEALVIAGRLSNSGRRDLAALVGAHLIRAVWASVHGIEPPPDSAIAVADVGRGILCQYGSSISDSLRGIGSDSRIFLTEIQDAAIVVTYPVRCLRILEVLGLMGLALEEKESRAAVAASCIQFIKNQPGASHPMSDNWAVSIIPCALLIWEFDPDFLSIWISAICVWIADRYERGELGLAGTWSLPEDELRQLLGGALPASKPSRRSESFIASVLLDLSSALEMDAVYNGVINEVMAAKIYPQVVECDDSLGQYCDAPVGVFMELWMRYDGYWDNTPGWQCAPHHRRAERFYLMRIGREWDLLAIGSVLRDRAFPLLFRALVGLPAT